MFVATPCARSCCCCFCCFFVVFFLIHRSHSISFTRAQGIPKYKIGFGRKKDGRDLPKAKLALSSVADSAATLAHNLACVAMHPYCAWRRGHRIPYPSYPLPLLSLLHCWVCSAVLVWLSVACDVYAVSRGVDMDVDVPACVPSLVSCGSVRAAPW